MGFEEKLVLLRALGGKYQFHAQSYLDRVDQVRSYLEGGKITKSLGLVYEAYLPGASVGSVCRILDGGGKGIRDPDGPGADAEVIGFRDRRAVLMPFEEARGVNNESTVVLKRKTPTCEVGGFLLGRIIDGRGNPIDGKGPLLPIGVAIGACETRSLYSHPADPVTREVIRQPLDLGVRAINALLTCGKGQRMGIMAGSGVGKSVLLGMMARNTQADANVIALIGERGREVREFIERDLGPEGLRRSVVVVATSDKSPLLRTRAAYMAATIAEHFRDRGRDVLFLMDSVTRFAMALREIGLSLGEPPTSRGYTPSVFASMPKLLERLGTTTGKGSITGLVTVLVEADDIDDPIGDATRSILDGHIVLSRRMAQRNHFPAIDVLQSTSRVMAAIAQEEHKDWAARVREWMALYAQAEDLINIGAYAKGTNAKIDQAVAVIDRVNSMLRQKVGESGTLDESRVLLHSIVRAAEAFAAPSPPPAAAPTRVGRI